MIRVNPMDYKQFKNTKFISISPGGIFGFYTLGISGYLIENYNLSKYSFIGASAGAWNALFCTYNKNHTNFIDNLLKQQFFDNMPSISTLQYDLRNYLVNNYNTCDFDLEKLYICVSELHNSVLQPNIIKNLTSLEQAIDCCIVSSHIPYITSDQFIKTYNDKISFDGGFFKFPPKSIYNHYVMYPSKYNPNQFKNMLFSFIKTNISANLVNELYNEGYNDAKNDKLNLDYIFGEKSTYVNIIDNEFDITFDNL